MPIRPRPSACQNFQHHSTAIVDMPIRPRPSTCQTWPNLLQHHSTAVDMPIRPRPSTCQTWPNLLRVHTQPQLKHRSARLSPVNAHTMTTLLQRTSLGGRMTATDAAKLTITLIFYAQKTMTFMADAVATTWTMMNFSTESQQRYIAD